MAIRLFRDLRAMPRVIFRLVEGRSGSRDDVAVVGYRDCNLPLPGHIKFLTGI
jgi:hypothetical protein